MEHIDSFNTLAAHKTIQALSKRNMEGYYCETKEDALKKVLELIPEGSKVSWGGSQTLLQVGIIDALNTGNYVALDRSQAQTPEEYEQIHFEAMRSDYYLMSTNAVTKDGKLVNIDGSGNRLAALMFGPKNVIVVAGMNKLVSNEDMGISRARNFAAPLNAMRLKRATPCVTTGLCNSCHVDDCICSHTVITRASNKKNRIKVILVGETLGF